MALLQAFDSLIEVAHYLQNAALPGGVFIFPILKLSPIPYPLFPDLSHHHSPTTSVPHLFQETLPSGVNRTES